MLLRGQRRPGLIGAAKLGALATRAVAGWTLVTHAAAGGTGSTAVTPGVDTTGANVIYVTGSSFGTAQSLADSKGNAWTPFTQRGSSGSVVQAWRCINPIVGTGHTFTVTTSAGSPSVAMAAFASGTPTPTFDRQAGSASNSGTMAQPGSITPANAGSLVVVSLTFYPSGTLTINSGFTITDQINYASGMFMGCGLAYLVQTTAAAVNPAWSHPGFSDAAVEISSFAP